MRRQSLREISPIRWSAVGYLSAGRHGKTSNDDIDFEIKRKKGDNK